MNGGKYIIDWALLAKWSSASNIVIALFAGVVCFVYWKQLVTMRKALAETKASNDIAARDLELGRRAWIIPQMTTEPLIQDELGQALKVYFVNAGSVPGVVARVGFGVQTLRPDFGPIEVDRYEENGPIVIPGPPQTFLFVRLPDLSAAMPGIESGERVLVVACRVVYRDVFDKERETGVQWFMDKDGKWSMIPGFYKMT
jgi:hypothetical protein